MAGLTIVARYEGRGLIRIAQAVKQLGSGEAKRIGALALNQIGHKATTAVKRSLVQQTGIRYGALVKDIHTTESTAVSLEFRIRGTGYHHGLVEFGAHQTGGGVSAAPWNVRRTFKHTFVVNANRGYFVAVRTSHKRLPLHKLWGPAIPKEMMRDQVPVVFKSFEPELQARVEAKLGQFLKA